MSSYNPVPVYFQQRAPTGVTADSIRPIELYLESASNVEPGHLVAWTGQAAMFSQTGKRIDTFSGDEGLTHALGAVTENSTNRNTGIAGVVLERAATPNATSFLHKGVHAQHLLKNPQHILRVATKGSVVLAWVLDIHENALEGVYQKNVNGVPSATAVIRELGDFFTITETSTSPTSLADDLAALTARMDSLTNS